MLAVDQLCQAGALLDTGQAVYNFMAYLFQQDMDDTWFAYIYALWDRLFFRGAVLPYAWEAFQQMSYKNLITSCATLQTFIQNSPVCLIDWHDKKGTWTSYDRTLIAHCLRYDCTTQAHLYAVIQSGDMSFLSQPLQSIIFLYVDGYFSTLDARAKELSTLRKCVTQ